MAGMNASTGKTISGIDHLRQSIIDILTTPIGTRVMQRDYGSRLYQLVDSPINSATLVQIYAAAVEALSIWEPRFVVDRVQAESAEPGKVVLALTGQYLPDGREIKIDGIEVT